jgi:peptidoglycan/LPS O-acetylase OafA/YrhL
LKYRADIDGLRAIAIVTVLLDHLDVTGFTGGFVGVDVFFVISGYLITTLIAEAQAKGTFSLAVFYERRMRRIFPALLVTLLATLAAGAALMTPADFEDLGKSVGAAAISGANFWFWSSSGYFAPDAERLALLHTWSLAVEEQYYLIFPTLMIGLAAAPRLPRRGVLAGLALVSFFWSAATSDLWPNAAFYLLPARAGELLLGALVALTPPPRLDARGREVVAFLGLVLIAVAVAVIDRADPFPSWRAALPCLGTAMVIHAGRAGSSATARLLALPPMRFFGAISYSLYLWHWPVIVFARYRFVDDLDAGTVAGLAALSVGLATLSWWFVERPFRHAPDPTRTPRVLAVGVVSALAVGFLGVGAWVSKGLPSRMAPEIRDVADPAWGRFRGCLKGVTAADARADRLCRLGSADVAPSFLLVGDSFAAALADGIDAEAKKAGVAGRFVGVQSCPPILGLKSGAGSSTARAACEATKADLAAIVAATGVRTVVLHSVWANFDGERGRTRLLAGSGIASATAEADVFLKQAVERTVEMLRGTGVRVVVVGAVPMAAKNVPATLARARLSGRPADVALPPARAEALNHTATTIFADLAGRGLVDLVSPLPVLCAGDHCRVEVDGRPLYADAYHLNLTGSALVAAAIWPRLGLTGR